MRHRWTQDELAAIQVELVSRRIEEVAAAMRVHPKALRSALRRSGISIRYLREVGKPKRVELGIVARRPYDGYAPASYGATALIALPEGRCHWPYGDPAEPGFAFCGCHVDGRGSYCAVHQGLAYEQAASVSSDHKSAAPSASARRRSRRAAIR